MGDGCPGCQNVVVNYKDEKHYIDKAFYKYHYYLFEMLDYFEDHSMSGCDASKELAKFVQSLCPDTEKFKKCIVMYLQSKYVICDDEIEELANSFVNIVYPK